MICSNVLRVEYEVRWRCCYRYECSCGAGWRLVGRRCVDRDECKELPYVCAGGDCHNFNGGSGFVLNFS